MSTCSASPMPKRAVLLLILTITFPRSAQAQPVQQIPAPLQGFDGYVQQAVEDWGVVGLAVAVIEDGEVVFAEGYGLRELGRPEPVTSHTRFAIGSTTKAITAAAVGMLVDEGKLDWDDRVIDHLPGFRLKDPWMTRELRVRDLLTHRTGMGNTDFLWYGRDLSTDEIVDRLRYADPSYSMRAGYVYQNVMYAVAGEVIEAVSGMPWSEFVARRMLPPLGMDETVTTLAALQGQPEVASPHAEVDGELMVIENASVDAVAPAGSIWSSVSDMAKWIGFLQRGGVLPDSTRLLERDTFAELFTPQTLIPQESFYPSARLTEPHWTTYAMGWFQADYEGRAVDFHTGSIDGMVAIAGMIRDEGIGVYVLANRDHVEVRHALMYRVFDLYDDQEPRDWSGELKQLYDGMAARQQTARARRGEQRVEGTAPTLDPERYAGTYRDELYGTVEVAWRGDHLYATFGPDLKGPMEHWHYDTFRVRFEKPWKGTAMVQFELDTRGRPAVLEQGGIAFRRVER